jgi:hypothetical protein
MVDKLSYEDNLVGLWAKYAARPTELQVNPVIVAEMAKHRPGGGSSRDRRRWKRTWTPRPEVTLAS